MIKSCILIISQFSTKVHWTSPSKGHLLASPLYGGSLLSLSNELLYSSSGTVPQQQEYNLQIQFYIIDGN